MNFEKIKRILIIRLSSLGDILLSTPLLRSIKKQYPDVQIDFVLREEYADILKNNPYVRKIFTYSNSQYEKHSLFNSLISENYDLAVDLHKNFRTKELVRVLKCNVVTFNKNDINKFLLVHFKINKIKKSPPIPVRYTVLLPGIKLDNGGLEIFTSNNPTDELKINNPLIGLCPGSRHYTKRWPENYYIELGKMLEENGYKIVLFGGLDDKETCSKVSEQLSNSINLSNNNLLLQTAADMKMCKAIVCNDSGLMHLATAVDVPVVALFGSTVKEFGFFPYNSKNIVLQNNSLSCRPCTHIGKSICPKSHFKCLKDITPQNVFTELNKLIGDL